MTLSKNERDELNTIYTIHPRNMIGVKFDRSEPMIKKIASVVDAYRRCIETGNSQWVDRHLTTLEYLNEFLPHGSGFDGVTKIDVDKSTGEKIVIFTEFHHMNDGGYYDGWTDHEVIATPSLIHDVLLRVTGRDRNHIKDYIHDTFYTALVDTMVSWNMAPLRAVNNNKEISS